MALATFKHFPRIKEVRGGLMFVVSNELVKGTYELAGQGELWGNGSVTTCYGVSS